MKQKKPLTADKELFRLWYEFYLLALTDTDKTVVQAVKKSKKFYADWEVKIDQRFDDWWVTHRQLFEQQEFVRLISNEDGRRENTLLIEIPRNKSRTEVFNEIKEILLEKLPVQNKKSEVINLRYQPTEIQGSKSASLRLLLDLERKIFRNQRLKGEALRNRVLVFLEKERFKKEKTLKRNFPAAMQIATYRQKDEMKSTLANVDRYVRRYRQKARQIVINVANGQFPGKY